MKLAQPCHVPKAEYCMTDKLFLSSNALLNDSVTLALKILESGQIPDLLAGIWRGGAPVAIAIHETLRACGHDLPHTVIRAASYDSIDKQGEISLAGLDSLHQDFPDVNSILLVDDVFDTGRTLQAIVDNLAKRSLTSVSVATPWYKPARRCVKLKPDFWLHETDRWLVFPHELCGLQPDELNTGKHGLSEVTRSALLSRIRSE